MEALREQIEFLDEAIDRAMTRGDWAIAETWSKMFFRKCKLYLRLTDEDIEAELIERSNHS
jgi:hypothetical protein